MLICPVCKNELKKVDRKYTCCNNHTFDLSKAGHANLLLSNQKNSKVPGDNKEMVLSRKDFLERDYYKGISDAVNETILEYTKDLKDLNILDIGCGEGYYTNRLYSALQEEKNINLVGIDISKEAMLAAAKSYKNITWLVASATNLPFSDNSLDLILCMYAKIVPAEFLRVLKKGGKLVIVSTGENHLLELKEVVYESVKKDFYLPALDESLKIFKHLESKDVLYKTEIGENSSIVNLFNMTPYRYRSPKEGVEKLFSLEKLTTTIQATIDVFQKD